MNEFQRQANRYKILYLSNLDSGYKTINEMKALLYRVEKRENYEACEGIKQAIAIKQKELSLN